MLPALLNLTPTASGQSNSPADVEAAIDPEKVGQATGEDGALQDFSRFFSGLSETVPDAEAQTVQEELADNAGQPTADEENTERDALLAHPRPEHEGDTELDKGLPVASRGPEGGSENDGQGAVVAAEKMDPPALGRQTAADATEIGPASAPGDVRTGGKSAEQMRGQVGEVALQKRANASPDLPEQSKSVAHSVRSTTPPAQETIAAQQFGLRVSAAARQEQTDTSSKFQFGMTDMAKPANGARGASDEIHRHTGRDGLSLTHSTSQPSTTIPLAQPANPGQPITAPQANNASMPKPMTMISAADSVLLQSVGDAPVEMLWETSRSQASTHTPAIARPETPVHIARQMAEAVHKLPDKPVELTLNPEELGRVRLSISTAEAGITVNVLAERMETLDLMRRHIDQLAREFQNMGYENIAFSFGEGAQDSEGRTSEDRSAGPSNPETSDHPLPASVIDVSLAHAAAGLDIRL